MQAGLTGLEHSAGPTGARRLCLILAWFLCSPVLAADIQTSVDRNPVGLNESFQITFSAGETPDGSPDFAPLAQNFEILNQQRSTNMSLINGKASRTEEWNLSVMAKQAGELLIPPIAFGSDVSQPLTVIVKDTPDPQPNNNADLFLDVEANPESPYVQSQVLLTLRIYFRVQITRSSLSDLDIKDALVEQLGEDKSYRTQINGVEYGVLERKYAIFPQQSGLFTIAPITLSTEIISGRQPQFNGFFNRQMTETRRVSSKPITLHVLPVPDNFKDPSWLSSEALELSDHWSADKLQTKVGEPLTRTITLRAKGSTVGQLPELFKPLNLPGLKTYPDQPVLTENKAGDGLIAVREEKIAFIPNQGGDYVLPAITINWFNSKTQKIEQAVLPETTIHALATGGQSAAASDQPSSANSPNNVSVAISETRTAWFWPALSAFLALGWLGTLLWFYRKPTKTASGKPMQQKPAATNVDKQLKTACRENNPQSAKQALLKWGRQHFAADNLAAIAGQCPPALAKEITDLNHALYSGNEAQWLGESLWTEFAKTSVKANGSKQDDDKLQPLYRL